MRIHNNLRIFNPQYFLLIPYANIIEFTHWPVQRTYVEHMKSLQRKTNRNGCIRPPVTEINAENCPPDMLHMKKGIITKLVNQLVDWTLTQGKEEDLMAEMKHHKIPFVYVYLFPQILIS